MKYKMALIMLHKSIYDDSKLMDVLINGFDSMEHVSTVYPDVKVYRVLGAEVSKEDVVICPEIIKFEGANPLIIKYNVDI